MTTHTYPPCYCETCGWRGKRRIKNGRTHGCPRCRSRTVVEGESRVRRLPDAEVEPIERFNKATIDVEMEHIVLQLRQLGAAKK